jgi:hypothetical protein
MRRVQRQVSPAVPSVERWGGLCTCQSHWIKKKIQGKKKKKSKKKKKGEKNKKKKKK